jgi:hypothetical protein
MPGRGEPVKCVRLPVIKGDGRGRILEFEMGKLDAGGDMVKDGKKDEELKISE